MLGWIFPAPAELALRLEHHASRARYWAAWFRFFAEFSELELEDVPEAIKPAAFATYYWWRVNAPFDTRHRVNVCGVELLFVRDEQRSAIVRWPAFSEQEEPAPDLDFGDFQLEFCGVPPELLPQPGEYGHFLVRFAHEALDHATYQPPPGPHPVVVEWEGLTFHAWCEDGWVRVFEESHLHEVSGLSAWCEEHAREEE